MSEISIYILTHKKFNEEYDKHLYKVLLNGSKLLKKDFGYIRDDTGDNISELNPYYAELTGQYWVWKNSKSDIVGFCHYRRYFARNILMKKLTEKDIITSLSKYDMIVPQRKHLKTNIIQSVRTKNEIESKHTTRHESSHKREDYYLLREIIKKKTPEYLESYDKMLNSNFVYLNNMFICKKELFDEYCSWIFNILEEFRKQTDFSTYGENKRVLGYLSERLLQVFINKHQLTVEEKYLLQTHIKIPFSVIIENKFPSIGNILNKVYNEYYKLKNR